MISKKANNENNWSCDVLHDYFKYIDSLLKIDHA